MSLLQSRLQSVRRRRLPTQPSPRGQETRILLIIYQDPRLLNRLLALFNEVASTKTTWISPAQVTNSQTVQVMPQARMEFYLDCSVLATNVASPLSITKSRMLKLSTSPRHPLQHTIVDMLEIATVPCAISASRRKSICWAVWGAQGSQVSACKMALARKNQFGVEVRSYVFRICYSNAIGNYSL